MAITIKPANRGKYRAQTKTRKGAKVSEAKEERDVHSKNKTTRERAQFALNARKWSKKGK